VTDGASPPRLLLGNLDGEADLALDLPAAQPAAPASPETPAGSATPAAPAAPESGGRRLRRSWTAQAAAAASAAASLLRALARPGDQLWLPASPALLAAERFASLPGVPRPEIVAGPPGRLRPAGELLAWCETAAVQALRARQGERPRQPVARQPAPGLGGPLHEVVWRLPRPLAAVVAATHHRAFCLQVRRELDCELRGARMVDSYAALAAHLEALAAGADLPAAPARGERPGARGDGAAPGAGFSGSWVVKAPLSAAGRWRAIHRHDLAPDELAQPGFRRRVENLFARHGALLFEPWMEREADFGAAGLLLPDGVRWVSFHRQRVDVHGQVTGLDLDAGPPDGAGGAAGDLIVDGMARAELAVWQEALDGVAGALARAGYVGPFGVDAWRFRGRDGRSRLLPVGEINARLTLGLLARALVDRLRGPLGLGAGDRVGLRLGTPPPAHGGAVRREIVPLLASGAAGEPGAWLELDRRAGRSAGSQG
jgi:hypothetical protein